VKSIACCFAFLIAVPTFVSACGGSQPPAETAAPPEATAPVAPAESAAPAPPTASAAPAAEATTPPADAKPSINWDAMDHQQRLEHMKNVVMPRMKELFAEFDAKRYGEMKCVTCHGDGAKNQTFKMPNPKLPKLSYTDGFKKHLEKTPAITKFMMEKVVPEMASLLGEQPYDPATKKGFGCAECHVMGP
jgi:hypothetical protein